MFDRLGAETKADTTTGSRVSWKQWAIRVSQLLSVEGVVPDTSTSCPQVPQQPPHLSGISCLLCTNGFCLTLTIP